MHEVNRQGVLELSGAPSTPDPAEIRARLHALLALARDATHIPWDARETRLNAILFRQMANWLPEPERDQLRAAFAAEMRHLGAT